jgi:hypothetical protein
MFPLLYKSLNYKLTSFTIERVVVRLLGVGDGGDGELARRVFVARRDVALGLEGHCCGAVLDFEIGHVMGELKFGSTSHRSLAPHNQRFALSLLPRAIQILEYTPLGDHKPRLIDISGSSPIGPCGLSTVYLRTLKDR